MSSYNKYPIQTISTSNTTTINDDNTKSIFKIHYHFFKLVTAINSYERLYMGYIIQLYDDK